MPSGASNARSSAKAISWIVFLLVGRALDPVLGAVDLDVVGATPRACAPRSARALSLILSAALIAAVMPTDEVRLPYEP